MPCAGDLINLFIGYFLFVIHIVDLNVYYQYTPIIYLGFVMLNIILLFYIIYNEWCI